MSQSSNDDDDDENHDDDGDDDDDDYDEDDEDDVYRCRSTDGGHSHHIIIFRILCILQLVNSHIDSDEIHDGHIENVIIKMSFRGFLYIRQQPQSMITLTKNIDNFDNNNDFHHHAHVKAWLPMC